MQQRRWRRYLFVLLAIWGAWLLLANAWLNSPLPDQWINRKPDRFQIHWQRGLSLWPGHVVLWDVRVQGQVRQEAWFGHAARASGRIALLPLMRKTLRIPGISASDVRFELHKADTDLAPRPHQPGGWTLRFDSIHTDSLRSMQLHEVGIAGQGSAEVGVIKTLRGGALELTPSWLRMTGVGVTVDDRVWLHEGEVDLKAALARHTREQAHGWQRLRLFDGDLRLSGTTPSLALQANDDHWWTRIVDVDRLRSDPSIGKPGRLSLALAVEQGQWQPGGKVSLVLPIQAADPAGGWQAQADLDLSVDDEGLRLKATLPSPPGDSGQAVVDLAIAGRELPLADWRTALLPRLSGRAGIDWHFQSLDWLGPVLARAPWLRLTGSGRVNGDLRLEAGRLVDGSRLDVPALDVVIDVLDNRFTGRGRAAARVGGSAEAAGTTMQVTVDAFQMAPIASPQTVYVQGQALTLDVEGVGDLFSLRETVAARLQFKQAQVPDLRVYNDYLPGDAVTLLGGRATLSGDLRLDHGGDVGEARLRIDSQRTRLELADKALSVDLAIDARLRQRERGTRRFDLAGSTISLGNLQMLAAEHELDPRWWARLTIDSGRLVWSRPWRFDAELSAAAKSAAPILGLFARKRDYPRWLLRLVDDGDARLTGRVRMNRDRLLLDPLRISNDRFDIQARLRFAARRLVGQLLASWRRLSVGLELQGNDRDWHLRNSKVWFQATPLPPH